MKRPTAAQLKSYADEIGFRGFDPQKFLDHYESNGWKVGRVSMKDWKATVRNWRRQESEYAPRKPTSAPISVRNARINNLNKRKAALLRMNQTPTVLRELEQIRIQLFDL